jgi:hypothetical protein
MRSQMGASDMGAAKLAKAPPECVADETLDRSSDSTCADVAEVHRRSCAILVVVLDVAGFSSFAHPKETAGYKPVSSVI